MFYLGVDDVSAYLAQIEAAGGRIDVQSFEVPRQTVFGIILNQAGNQTRLAIMNQGQRPTP